MAMQCIPALLKVFDLQTTPSSSGLTDCLFGSPSLGIVHQLHTVAARVVLLLGEAVCHCYLLAHAKGF